MKTKHKKNHAKKSSAHFAEDDSLRTKKMRHQRKERAEEFSDLDVDITHLRNIDVNSLFQDDKMFF